MLKSHSILTDSVFYTRSGSWRYHLLPVCWITWISSILKWIYLATWLCLSRYSVCAIFGHSARMCITVSLAPPHTLHLSLAAVLKMCFAIALVWTACSCAAHRKPSLSMVRFPLVSHWNVASLSIPSFIWRAYCPCSGFPIHFSFLSLRLSSLFFLKFISSAASLWMMSCLFFFLWLPFLPIG